MRIKDCHAVVSAWTICLAPTDRKKTGLILTSVIRLHDFNFNIFITWGKGFEWIKIILYTIRVFWFLLFLA